MKNEVIAQMVLTHVIPTKLQGALAIKAHSKGMSVVEYIVKMVKKDLKSK